MNKDNLFAFLTTTIINLNNNLLLLEFLLSEVIRNNYFKLNVFIMMNLMKIMISHTMKPLIINTQSKRRIFITKTMKRNLFINIMGQIRILRRK